MVTTMGVRPFTLSTRTIACSFSLLILFSCGSSRKINTDYFYFRDGKDTVLSQQNEIAIQANDVLSIQVFSKTQNQEQVTVFNLPAGVADQGYQVNSAGTIDFPIIGSVKASGLTREQLQAQLTQKLVSYVKNPSVLVRFQQFTVNVLGEVRNPGTQKFTANRVTVIDALGAAGDLTDNGKRKNIKVIREENGQRVYHTVDLRSKAIFESPVYILQPNDIVYVEPNEKKLKELDTDPEKQRRTNLFLGIFSLVISAAILVVSLLR